MHKLGIIHRDLKPANILVAKDSNGFDEASKLIIADLGISFKLRDANDSSAWRIGTVGFMAPEVFTGQDYTHSCDIFSLGCLLYWFISSKRPFWSIYPDYRLEALLQNNLNLDSDEDFQGVSEPCKHLIRQMLEKNPQNRPSIEQVVSHQWVVLNS